MACAHSLKSLSSPHTAKARAAPPLIQALEVVRRPNTAQGDPSHGGTRGAWFEFRHKQRGWASHRQTKAERCVQPYAEPAYASMLARSCTQIVCVPKGGWHRLWPPATAVHGGRAPFKIGVAV